HLITIIAGFEADGYSIIYQYAIGFAALFYLWLGLRFLRELLNHFTKHKGIISICIFVIAFGTNIIFYALVEPSMAHVYNFAMITGFFYSISKIFTSKKVVWLALSSTFLGILLITRPTNAIILLMVPFLARNPSELKARYFQILRKPKQIFFLLTPIIVLLIIPPVIWYAQTGYFFVYTYGEAGFNFLHPAFRKTLFSYNRGWFIFTPAAFVSLFGVIGLFKTSRFRFYAMIVFLFLFIYLTASWWNWHFASKFGHRNFIDIYAVVAILLVFLLLVVKNFRFLFRTIKLLLILLIGLNLFQFYQQTQWIFPANYLTREIYWDSFFRLTPTAKVYLEETMIENKTTYLSDFESDTGWVKRKQLLYHDSNTYAFSDTANPYILVYKGDLSEQFESDSGIVKITADINSDVRYSKASLNIDFQTSKFSYSKNTFYFGAYNQNGEWTRMEFAVYTHPFITSEDSVKVFFYDGDSTENLLVDNIKIDFITLLPGNSPAWITNYISNIEKSENIFLAIDQEFEKSGNRAFGNKITYKGSMSYLCNSQHPFSITFTDSLHVQKDKEKYMIITTHIYPLTELGESRLITDYSLQGNSFKYEPYFLNQMFNQNQWNKLINISRLPKKEGFFKVKVYFWNPSIYESFYIDDINIDYITLKEKQ
ncbi:MAG: hypothetical protein K8R53_02865, partial [Bacteroidales bacterium]|nr:hypothetical protein [Bacteroidales bacterium]